MLVLALFLQNIMILKPCKLKKADFLIKPNLCVAAPVIVLGHDVDENLFESYDPLGKEVRLYGRKFTVIGVLEKNGPNLFGNSHDTNVFLPVNVVRRIYGGNNRGTFPQIVIKPREDVDNAEFMAMVSQQLRNIQRLKNG